MCVCVCVQYKKQIKCYGSALLDEMPVFHKREPLLNNKLPNCSSKVTSIVPYTAYHYLEKQTIHIPINVTQSQGKVIEELLLNLMLSAKPFNQMQYVSVLR